MISAKIEFICSELENLMSKKRFLHSWGCARTCRRLARGLERYISSEDAFIMGLCHDTARDFSDRQIMSEIHRLNLHAEYREWKKTGSFFVHAPLSAILTKEKQFCTNPAVFKAVYYHPTGCERMSVPHMLLTIADFCEPSRSFAAADKIRSSISPAPDVSSIRQICIAVMKTKKALYQKNRVSPPSLFNSALESLQSTAAGFDRAAE